LSRISPPSALNGFYNVQEARQKAAEVPLQAGDQIVSDKLWELGYEVTEVPSGDLAFYTEVDYADYNFIFTSKSVGSSSLALLKGHPLPLVNSEPWASKPSALARSDPASAENLTPEPILIVAETDNPLAAGFSAGDVVDIVTDPAGGGLIIINDLSF